MSGKPEDPSPEAMKRRPFEQKTYSLAAEQLFPWDKALATADAIEDAEILRKMARDRKADSAADKRG
jgi:hypothetical protein